MSPKGKLSNRVVKDLPAGAKPYLVYDSVVTGFCVVVQPTGRKAFYWYGWKNGRPQRIKIGNHPETNSDAARQQARDIIGRLARGEQVTERKPAGRRTVDDLYAYWLENHARPGKLRTLPQLESNYRNFLQPKIGKLPLGSFRRDTAKATIAGMQKVTFNEKTKRKSGGIGAARMGHSLLSSMFNLGVEIGWIDASPMARLHRPNVLPRERYLKAVEVEQFMKAVAGLRSTVAADFIRLCLFTGARRANVASMRWDEIDGDRWKIPAVKAKRKRPITISLTSHALAIIDSRRGNGSEWVLPAPRAAGRHYRDPKHAWEKVRELSGLDDIRLHDLRRSVGAWLQAGGASLRTTQLALGHSDPSVTARVYQPTESRQVLEAMEAATSAMLGRS